MLSFFLIATLLSIFLSVMINNQRKCGVIYEKITLQVVDEEQMINYNWP